MNGANSRSKASKYFTEVENTLPCQACVRAHVGGDAKAHPEVHRVPASLRKYITNLSQLQTVPYRTICKTGHKPTEAQCRIVLKT